MTTVVSGFVSRNIISKKVLFRNAGGMLEVLDFTPKGRELVKQKRKPRLHFRYQAATLYVRMIQRPDFKELRRIYESVVRPGSNLYDRIVSDYNVPPVVHSIRHCYTGVPGEKIKIDVQDDFIVKHVWIEIYNGREKLVEKGEALLEGRSLLFSYTTQRRNSQYVGSKIVITAADMSCNMTEAVFSLNTQPQNAAL